MQMSGGSSDGERIRVFIVDDHVMVREGLRAVLDQIDDIEVIGEAGTVAEATERIPSHQPDVALVDVKLPDGSGIEICRSIGDAAPSVRCLILTSLTEEEALFDAVLAGAAGYVLKQIRTDELVSCIRRVAKGATLVDDRAARHLRERARDGDADPLIAALSDQERRLLVFLGEGLTNRQIADEMVLAEKTVKNYVSRLLMKMGMSRRSEAAVHSARSEERRRFVEEAPDNPVRY